MNTFVYPIEVNGQEILIVHDDKCVTWLNVTDPAVKVDLIQYIDSHPESGITDLIAYCVETSVDCGLIFDASDVNSFTGFLS